MIAHTKNAHAENSRAHIEEYARNTVRAYFSLCANFM